MHCYLKRNKRLRYSILKLQCFLKIKDTSSKKVIKDYLENHKDHIH